MDWRSVPCREWTKGRTPRGYGKRTWQGRTLGAHRVAWIEAHGPIPDGIEVCHHCDNPPCIEVAHLFLGTSQDNADDMVRKGRSTRGERNNTTKLREADVLAIREAWAAGGVSARALAAQYGVRHYTIQCIVKGTTWRHLLPTG